MAKYTTELRSICETYAGYSEQQSLGNTSAVIQAALPKLFDFDFPIYDESYRNVLETKIVRHFYTREIGAETVGRWKLFLEDRLNMIMPYYNKLYKSELIEFNPMYDVDLTTDHSKGNEGNAESQQNRTDTSERNRTYNRNDNYSRDLKETNDYTRNLANSDSTTTNENRNEWDMYSDTPQGGITGLESNNYLTNATHRTATNSTTSNSNGSETGTSNSAVEQTGTDNRTVKDTDDTSINNIGNTNGTSKYTDTESYLEHVKGKTSGVSYSKLLEEYRDSFINIDNMIIGQLNDLFINLW